MQRESLYMQKSGRWRRGEKGIEKERKREGYDLFYITTYFIKLCNCNSLFTCIKLIELQYFMIVTKNSILKNNLYFLNIE